MSVNPE